MKNHTPALHLPAVTAVPQDDIDCLLSAGSGEAALVYLYLLRHDSRCDPASAARELHRSERDIRSALDELERMGLLQTESDPPAPAPIAPAEKAPTRAPLPADELPSYTTEEIIARAGSDTSFSALVQEAQGLFGRTLSGPELSDLFTIYDYLAMPPDVILLLLHHCQDDAMKRHRRPPSFRVICREAFAWHNEGLTDYESAERHLADRARLDSAMGEARQRLGLADRTLSPTERDYLTGWLKLGFPPDSLVEAYDRTVTNTGGLKWAYMNGILLSWHEKNLHTPAEIRRGDPRKAPTERKSGSAAKHDAPAAPDRTALERMKKLQEKIRNGT